MDYPGYESATCDCSQVSKGLIYDTAKLVHDNFNVLSLFWKRCFVCEWRSL